MTRGAAVWLTVALLVNAVIPAAGAFAQAVAPFPEVPLPHPPARPRRLAYATMLGGAALIGSSFFIERSADRTYDRYLAATDPGTIDRLYRRTRLEDNVSTATLIGGEAVLAWGLYLRFLRRPPAEHVSLSFGPGACAVSLRF